MIICCFYWIRYHVIEYDMYYVCISILSKYPKLIDVNKDKNVPRYAVKGEKRGRYRQRERGRQREKDRKTERERQRKERNMIPRDRDTQ